MCKNILPTNWIVQALLPDPVGDTQYLFSNLVGNEFATMLCYIIIPIFVKEYSQDGKFTYLLFANIGLVWMKMILPWDIMIEP